MYQNCEQLIKHYAVVTEGLQFEIDQGENGDSVQAIVILISMLTMDFIVNLIVFFIVS